VSVQAREQHGLVHIRSLVCVWLFLLVACGDSGSDRSGLGSGDDDSDSGDPGDDDGDGDGHDDDGGEPDAQPPPPDAGVDAGTGADASTGGMVIDSVLVDGSFTQVRQGTEFQILITGSGLESVNDITLDSAFIYDPETLVVTPTEVRAQMFLYHGSPPGPRTVTLVSPDGNALAPDAIEVTPFVVEADAAIDGRGTYESPMLYCGPLLGDALQGDIVLLRAGEHVCESRPYLGSGVEVRGEGVEATILRSPGFDFSTEQSQGASVQDLTVISSDPAGLVSFSTSGPVAIRDVRLVGLGIDSGPAREFSQPGFVLERVDISDCATGVSLADGRWTITDVTVEGCDTGMRLAGDRFNELSFTVDVTDVELLDNRLGIATAHATLRVIDTAVRDIEATPTVAEYGIRVSSGYLTVSNVEITGVDLVGVGAYTTVVGDDYDRALLTMSGLVVEGGLYGVEASGSGEGVFVQMANAVIRDQSVAAFSFRGIESSGFQLDNVELSVSSGFALEDMRGDPEILHAVNSALSTTLNGRSYEGQLIEGPVDMPPDLRIVDNGAAVQF
jgi:hypothetical protein